MLRGRGMTETDDVAAADLIVLNTCSVREKATNKVFSELGRIQKRKRPDALFGIVGCVARESGADAFRRIPELNFVLGPQSYHKLPEILDNPDSKLLNIDLSGLEKFDELNYSNLKPQTQTCLIFQSKKAVTIFALTASFRIHAVANCRVHSMM